MSKSPEQLQPGVRFYFKHPDWIKQQDEKIGPALFTVLFELAMNKKPADEKEIAEILADLEEPEENVKIITELILAHKNDVGEIVWVKKHR